MSFWPGSDRRPGSPLAIALGATVVASLPPALVGSVGVEIHRDLGIAAGGLGIAVSSFFGASALFSAALGHLAARVGTRLSFALALAGSTAALLGIAIWASSVAGLAGCLALAGVANALMQPTVNGFLADATGGSGLGLAFGVKQSAIPLAALLSGLAVPAVALTVGWRGVFWGAAAFAAAAVVAALRMRRMRTALPRERDRGRRVPVRSVALLGLAAGFGAFGGTSLSTFLVASVVAGGFSQADAGLLLATGSSICIAVRLLAGVWADAVRTDGLVAVLVLMLVGSVGFAGLATAVPVLVIAGVVLAFGGGWGWPGVFQMAVVSRHPQAARVATGITQTGTFAGATVGPFAFGAIASASYAVAWMVTAGAALCGAALVALALAGAGGSQAGA